MVVSRWKLSITALNLNSDAYCLRLLVIGSYLLSLLTVYFIRYVTGNAPEYNCSALPNNYIRDQDDVIVEVLKRRRKRKAFCPSIASRSSERMLRTASITTPGGTSRSGKG
jgi:hypothetical protein